MKKRFLKTLCGLACPLLALDSEARAQETSPKQDESVILEDMPARLAKLDDLAQKKLTALLEVIGTEMTAKRVSKLAAEELRWTARNMIPPLGDDAQSLLDSARVPTDNEAIMAALNHLESEVHADRSVRDALISQGTFEVRRRVRETVFHSREPEDIAAVAGLLTKLDENVRAHARGGLLEPKMSVFGNCAKLLDSLSIALDAGVRHHDPESVELGIQEIKALVGSVQDIVTFDDAVIQLRELQSPWKAAIEKAQDALENAMAERKPAIEISATLKKLEEAACSYDVPGSAYRLSIYRTLAAIASARDEANSGGLSQEFDQLRKSISPALFSSLFDARREAALRDLLAQWEQEIKAASDLTIARSRESLVSRLNEVKQPSDLEALALDLLRTKPQAKPANGENPREDSFDSRVMGRLFASLAAAWSTGERKFMPGPIASERGVAFSDISTEVEDLRSRIEREVLVRVLNAPELNRPPLATQPIDEALNSFGDDLAAKKQWRRFLKVLEFQGASNDAGEVHPLCRECVNAVRWFLVGQNFELAGQWGDAAVAYKAVLRSAAENGPIQEAAERLRAFNKEHPAAFKAGIAHAFPR